jgi:hypothetical protein
MITAVKSFIGKVTRWSSFSQIAEKEEKKLRQTNKHPFYQNISRQKNFPPKKFSRQKKFWRQKNLIDLPHSNNGRRFKTWPGWNSCCFKLILNPGFIARNLWQQKFRVF